MSWIRFDDAFFLEDPAVMDLGADEAIAVLTYVRAVAYAARHLTDGAVPAGFVRREDRTGVDALVRVGLLELRPDGSAYLPRFLEVRDGSGRVVGGHHPSRETVEARRAARAEAGQVGGIRSGEVRRHASDEASSEANAKHFASQTAKQSANPGARSPSPLVPEPAPIAREAVDDAFDWLESREAHLDRANGHADMLRRLVDAHGIRAVMAKLEEITGPIVDAGDAAKYVGDALRPRPGPRSGEAAPVDPSAEARRRRRRQREQMARRFAITDEDLAAANRDDTPPEEMPGWAEWQAELRADQAPVLAFPDAIASVLR